MRNADLANRPRAKTKLTRADFVLPSPKQEDKSNANHRTVVLADNDHLAHLRHLGMVAA